MASEVKTSFSLPTMSVPLLRDEQSGSDPFFEDLKSCFTPNAVHPSESDHYSDCHEYEADGVKSRRRILSSAAQQRVFEFRCSMCQTGTPTRTRLVDFSVDNLPEAEQQLRALGAELASHQPGGQRFRVFLDPAGHPFCVTSSQMAATIPPDMDPNECARTTDHDRLHTINPATPQLISVTMADVPEVEVVVAHNERATVRVGEVFLKIDADQSNTDVEVDAMLRAPIPTAQILWHTPPVLALAALPGNALGRLGEPSTTSSAAWAAAGATVRMLHDAPLPPWPGRSLDDIASELDRECAWLTRSGAVATGVIASNRRIAETALRSWTPVFTHGDLQASHVFVNGDEVTGIIDWSEAAQGDPLYDLATLTLGHPQHLDDVIEGYGADVDLDVIRAWWSLRSLRGVRWLIEHGFNPAAPGCEIDVLNRQAIRG